jgi:transcriptional regulator with GAF, ATPase, and Fis domain
MSVPKPLSAAKSCHGDRLVDVRCRASSAVEATLARYRALIGVSEALRAHEDRDQLFRSLARELTTVVRFDFLGLGLFDETTGTVVPFVLEANGTIGPLPTLESDEQLTHWTLQHGAAFVIPAVDEEPRFKPEMKFLQAQRARSVCCLPLITAQRSVGMLLIASRERHAYSGEEIEFLSLVANQVALAIDETRRTTDAREQATTLARRVTALAAQVDACGGRRGVVGGSEAWRRVLKEATQVADTEATVLLVGESGTGKEVLAKFIHRVSGRAAGPFVAVNCAALPEHLLESELFGYERGAFTGAIQSKPGQFELAAGGVLFLDELGELSSSAQAKLLRVLQEREFQRLGGTRLVKADVRIVAATNRNLRAEIERGAFREDLFYRLNVFEVRLPALRERRADILPLAKALLADIARSIGRVPTGISRDAATSLVNYDWPGNVRELRNVLERAAILCEGGLIAREHLAIEPLVAPAPRPLSSPETVDLRAIERTAIERALLEAKHNKSLAAKKLGVSRKQLYVRLRQHRLA